jgi:hypothetical protein
LCIIKKKKLIMSLEKSIQKLTQVIQAAKQLGCLGRERCTTMPRGGQIVCECQELNADCSVKTNGRVTITPGECARQRDRPMQTPRRPEETFGPPAPTDDYPQYSTCWWARQRMIENPNYMSDVCFDARTPVPHTRIEFYRDTPGGPIKTRESRSD